MNTALNFVSMPKDLASSVASGGLSPDKSAQLTANSSDGRQDLADGAENNASFANVLSNESHSEASGQDADGSSESKAGDTESTGTQQEHQDETLLEAGNSGDVILSELNGRIQANPQVEAVSNLNPQGPIVESSAGNISSDERAISGEQANLKTTDIDTAKSGISVSSSVQIDGGKQAISEEQANLKTTSNATAKSDISVSSSVQIDGGKQAISEEQANLKTTEVDPAKSGISVSASIQINGDKNTVDGDPIVTTDKMQHPTLSTAPQLASASGTVANASDESQPGRPLAISAEQIQGRATVQQYTGETDKQAITGSQPAAQSEEALAATAKPELKELLNKTNSISVSASLESLPAAGKPLPTTGKNLPAGLFFQGEGTTAIASRGEQATQPIDLNSELASKTNFAAQQSPDKGMEITGDKFMRNLLSATNAAAEATAPLANAPLSTDNAANTPPLLNPLLHVTADKALLAARAPLAAGAESALNLNITAQAGSAEWQSQLSGRIRWMGSLNISSAELKLHPAELGTVEIKISTEDDQTRISFITSNAAAKEVIESTLPRLREMLGEGGLNLEQGDVAQRDLSEEKQAHETLNNGNRAENEDGDEAELEQTNLHITRNSTSQIDHYV